MSNAFFYDGQIRRFILQFIRVMSHFQVEFGADSTGNKVLQQVPVVYGDSSRQVAQILRGNTENATPTVPAIACYVTGMTYDRDRVQEPYHVSKLNIREREYDHNTEEWGTHQGEAFTVERMMPVPYTLALTVDVWTSNLTQKLQLIEQILPLFNPALEIQSTDNYIDWTSLSALYLQGVNWSSRQVPVGADDTIDVFSMTFNLPIWLSLPAKVKKLGVIQKIIMSIYDDNGELVEDVAGMPGAALLARRVITPLNYGVVLFNGMLQLFRPDNIVSQTDTTMEMTNHVDTWRTFVDLYGKLQPGISTVQLEQPSGGVLVGHVVYHPTDDTLMLFTPVNDTLPTNSLPPVSAIVDPYNIKVDSDILNAAIGTRYLIVNPIGSADNVEAAQAWHGTDGSDLIADANDIIEYDGVRWFVSFSSRGQPDVKYVTNLRSGLQYKWDGTQWSKAVEGKYQPGEWTIVI